MFFLVAQTQQDGTDLFVEPDSLITFVIESLLGLAPYCFSKISKLPVQNSLRINFSSVT